MKIAILAAGGVGGYFGARYAAAGHDVAFVARGAHLEAIRQHGLRIESVHGNLHLPKVNVTDDPKAIGPVDIVLFAVKLWDTETAGELARPLIGPNTRLITVQNGVDSVERLTPILGAEHVVGGVSYIATVIAKPGVISQTSQFAGIRCGRAGGASDPHLQAFVDAGKAAGIDIGISKDIQLDRWQKFVFLASQSAATASTRMPMGPIREDPDTREFHAKLIREATAVARANGIKLPANFEEDRIAMADTVPYGMKASMAHDLDRGNRLELDWLSGRVVQLGRELGVPTPTHSAVYAILKLHRMGKRGAAGTSGSGPSAE